MAPIATSGRNVVEVDIVMDTPGACHCEGMLNCIAGSPDRYLSLCSRYAAWTDRAQGDWGSSDYHSPGREASNTKPISLPPSLEELNSIVSERSEAATRFPIQGRATYYHPSLAGGVMRDGVTRYDPMATGAVAATSWPVGTVLEVRGPTNRSLMVVVSDTGRLEPNHLDLSAADFQILVGDLRPGVAEVQIGER